MPGLLVFSGPRVVARAARVSEVIGALGKGFRRTEHQVAAVADDDIQTARP